MVRRTSPLETTSRVSSKRRRYPAAMDDDVVDRIERGFTAAVQAHAKPIRLEVARSQYEELSRQFGLRDGIRVYRGRSRSAAG